MNESPQLSPVADCPAWFKRLPLACWGWREVNRYGWPLLAAIVVLVWLGDPWRWAAIVPATLLAQLLAFFRDPPRQIPADAGAIVSPADGTIAEVTRLDHDEFLAGPAVRIGIFLSIFNVHINRAPLAVRVVELRYKPGEFLNALKPESAVHNESMWIALEEAEGRGRRCIVRQISGAIARRIVCPLQPGQLLSRGEKFGMIKLGSRTELILPADAVDVSVRVGDKVHAGSDVVARWK